MILADKKFPGYGLKGYILCYVFINIYKDIVIERIILVHLSRIVKLIYPSADCQHQIMDIEGDGSCFSKAAAPFFSYDSEHFGF